MMMNMHESGKQEEKQKMDPLFPRLYINDHLSDNSNSNAENKLGENSAPRNKMALYDHLTTHSSNPHHLQSNNSSTTLTASPFFDRDACTSKRNFIPSLCDSSGSSTATQLNLNPTLETSVQQYSEKQDTSKLKTLHPLDCYKDKKLSNNNDDRENTHKAKFSVSPINCTYGESMPAFQRQLKQSSTTNLKLRQYQPEDDTTLYPSTSKSYEPLYQNPKKRSLVDYITRYVDPNTNSRQSNLKDDKKALILAEARKKNDCNKVATEIPRENKAEKKTEISKFESNVSLPDGVFKVMGQKQFWDTRRTIVHQQRVFAVQVFELHRLIQVQRMIAGSPQLILGGSLCMGNPSKNMSIINMPYGKSLPTIPKKEIQYEIRNPTKNWAAKSEVTKIPLPTLKNETIKYEIPNLDARSHNKLAPFAATEGNLAPFCFHAPPGNQWLVPVRSPSEGLVYKPYTGPCLPNAGFVGPICGSVPIAPTYAGFLSGTPIGPTYFAPYRVQLMNPFPNVAENDLSINTPYQTSCNMPQHKSRESDLQGSTGSSTTERTRGEPLPLFPMEPAAQSSDQTANSQLTQLAQTHCFTERQIQVIKVVPHNPKSATESVARIFRSIQEERRVYN